MKEKMKNCPVCLNDKFYDLINFGLVPKTDFFSISPSQEPKKANLSFEYCNKCAFIRQRPIRNPHNYSDDERETKHLSPIYSLEIAESLDIYKNGLIIDIGSNDGSFLDVLSNSGFKNLLGIEPSKSCANICVSKGYGIENEYFNKKTARKIKNK